MATTTIRPKYSPRTKLPWYLIQPLHRLGGSSRTADDSHMTQNIFQFVGWSAPFFNIQEVCNYTMYMYKSTLLATHRRRSIVTMYERDFWRASLYVARFQGWKGAHLWVRLSWWLVLKRSLKCLVLVTVVLHPWWWHADHELNIDR